MTAVKNALIAPVLALGLCAVSLLAMPQPAAAAAPELSITTPAGGYTRNPLPVFKGSTTDNEDPIEVVVYAGPVVGGPVAETIMPLAGPVEGSWEASSESLSDGQYTAVVEQTHEAEPGSSPPVTFTLDTQAPAVTMNSVAPFTNDTTPTLLGGAGTASGDLSSVTVRLCANSACDDHAVSVSGGTWSYTAPTLAAGTTYTAQAIQEDEAGNVGLSTPPQTFTVDTTGPTVTVNPLASPTNNPKPSITGHFGTAPGDVSTVAVVVYRGSSASGSRAAEGTAAETGETSWSYSPHLDDGQYTVRASQSDKAGNTTASNTTTFVVDTTAPNVTLSTPHTNQRFSKSQPTFSGGAGTASGDSASVTVQIAEVRSGETVPVQTVSGIPRSGGSWTTGTSGPHLPNGEYTASVEQVDAAGNVGRTTPTTFLVESRSPVVTLSTLGVAHRGSEAFVGAAPSFTGFAQAASQDSNTISLQVYRGTSASGPVIAKASGERVGTQWTIAPIAALADGTYTAQATQEAAGEEPGFSESSTFTVDGDAPRPAILNPVNGATFVGSTVSLTGVAGTSPGDNGAVTVEVFPGASPTGAPSETVTVPVSAGDWSAPLGVLPAGTYTAQATQGDDVGNSGAGAPVTFSLSAPAPPAASFTWFPAAPHVGEPVSLVSTSTDSASAIVGYSWSLAGTGVFTPGAQTIGTSFKTAGNHVVRLLVTDQNGASSSISETIPVTSVPVSLMQPFPVVRIAGSEGSAGVKIKLLSVQAPIGAKVSIACKGRGCPAKLVSALAAASKGKHAPGSALITFKRFERLLPPGVTLEIKVSKSGVIGKFTRFVSRKHKLPTRSDSCLSLFGKPMLCPST